MTKASLSGLAFLINLAQERDSPGGFATLDRLRACGACGLRWKTLRVSSAPLPCGFESLCGQQKSEPFGPASAINLAGYVRVSTNTYAYGIRRGFALLVTDVAL